MFNNLYPSEFYRGKHRKRRPIVIAAIILAVLLVFLILLFYGLQKYIVVTNEGIHLEIPFLTGSSGMTISEEDGSVTKVYDEVTAELVVGETDYSTVRATAGGDLSAIKAVYVPFDDISESKLNEYADGLEAGNALVLELKDTSGSLAWNSSTELAVAYGMNGTTDLESIVSSLKERNIYLVASIACCVDEMLADRYPATALTDEKGVPYTDDAGSWLNPYSSELRSYIASLCKELSEMGFDEIMLTYLRHPVSEDVTFAYTGSSVANPTPLTAVSGFALDVTRSLGSCSAKISVQCNSSTALDAGEDEVNGQNAVLFFKIFDRVYYSCSYSEAASIVSSASKYVEVGDVAMRLVPICYGGYPDDTSCWVSKAS